MTKTGFLGTFVISWAQTQIDGLAAAPLQELRVGGVWRWDGDAVRIDGPRGVLPLGPANGETELRHRIGTAARRFLGQTQPGPQPAAAPSDAPLEDVFTVTDGRAAWEVSVVRVAEGRAPLLTFHNSIPPRGRDLWVVSKAMGERPLKNPLSPPGGVVCFTPGTQILTEDGPCDVAALAEGDRVQTQDNGCAEILWIGQRRISGARLAAMRDLVPVRLRKGALGADVPDEGLLVSPDHRVVLRGARARALWGEDEVLVCARDLIDDYRVMRDYSAKCVTYIHMMLPRHDIVFANGVATDSFHPAHADLAAMRPIDRERLFERLPELRGDPERYGAAARRMLAPSEAAILRNDAGLRQRR